MLSIASNVLLSVQVQATAATASLVNTAGRQRMLAIRISGDAEHAATSHDPRGLSDLRASLSLFAANHARLADPDSGLYTSGFFPEVRRLYSDDLNTRVQAFTAAAHRVLRTPLEQLRPNHPDVVFLIVQARGPLLKGLERAVSLDEHRSDTVIRRIQVLSWLRVSLVLLLLSGLGFFVFRPLERRNRDLMIRLSAERQAVARQAAYAQALLQVSALTDSPLPPETVAHQATAIVARTSGLHWAGLGIITAHRTQVACAYADPTLPGAVLARLNQPPRPGEGVVWDVLHSGQSRFVDEYAQQPGARPELVTAGLRGLAWVPLGATGETQYVLTGARLTAQPWTADDRDLFEAAARTVTVALNRRVYLQEVEAAALSDALTGLANRRAFERDLQALARHPGHHPSGLTVVMLDLDGLKAVNDTQGHEGGDALLRGFARALRATFRQDDRVYRLGGDEFAVVLDNGAHDDHAGLLARVAEAAAHLRRQGFATGGASAGCASFPGDGLGLEDTVRLADERMYVDKRRRKSPGRAHATH
ncbi:diguanylate cyclase domain-containing protein [Deinococcus koreensis]|uniref:GGDEF domain-containing protein n=1 Tax=Deinococcus koreensis TaxID=2054903 RepID=A0A2K3URW5_9DEIO|nr:diguanylate cyclase [Deinococcus koreensis]PNY79286.1 hypothetical protein CVO96_19345 [Deinococcus koreensis]